MCKLLRKFQWWRIPAKITSGRSTCQAHWQFLLAGLCPRPSHEVEPNSCLLSKYAVPCGSAPRRINSLTQTPRILHDCLNRWYKQINLAIFIREHLKVCFEQGFFLEEPWMLLKIVSEPWKSWNWLCWVGLQTGPQFPLPLTFPGISTLTYINQGPYKRDGSHPTGHLNFALTVLHFSRGSDCYQEELWYWASPRDESSVVFHLLAVGREA